MRLVFSFFIVATYGFSLIAGRGATIARDALLFGFAGELTSPSALGTYMGESVTWPLFLACLSVLALLLGVIIASAARQRVAMALLLLLAVPSIAGTAIWWREGSEASARLAKLQPIVPRHGENPGLTMAALHRDRAFTALLPSADSGADPMAAMVQLVTVVSARVHVCRFMLLLTALLVLAPQRRADAEPAPTT